MRKMVYFTFRKLIALFDSIKQHTIKSIKVAEVDAHINDENFSALIVNELLNILVNRKTANAGNKS